MSDFEWAKPQAGDKSFVKRHCPRARVVRFPGAHASWTCYLNKNPKKRDMAIFWAPSEKIAWAEGRRMVEHDLRKGEKEVSA